MVVTETAGSLVETPVLGPETMPPDLVAPVLPDSAWMTEEPVGTSEACFLFGASKAGFLVGAWETETLLPLFVAVSVTGLYCEQQMYCCNQRFHTVFFNLCSYT